MNNTFDHDRELAQNTPENVVPNIVETAELLSGAKFSEDGKYRYALWRFWNYPACRDGNAKAVMFIMANASTAGAFTDDPTVIRCVHYAQRWGYDGIYIGNLCALIETHWTQTEELGDRVGEFCDHWLDIMRNSSALHIAAWGFMGKNYPERAEQVRGMFPELHYLELSLKGIPKHPLYLKSELRPLLWESK